MSTSLGKHVTLTKPDDFGKLLEEDRKSTRLNSSHDQISYAVFCLKKKKLHDLEIQYGSDATKDHAEEARRQSVFEVAVMLEYVAETPTSKGAHHVAAQNDRLSAG